MGLSDPELLERVRAARLRLETVGPREVRAQGDFELVSLPKADAEVLEDLMLTERPTTVVEVGLGYGTSALAIAAALLEAGVVNPRHLIIDAYQDRFHRAGWNLIVETGLTLCSLVEERSQLALPRLLSDGFVADAAFVDGSHTFHNVFVDLYYLRELVKPGGLVILDDLNLQSVAAAVRYFELNAGWKTQAARRPTRLCAFRLPDPPFEPRFESFTSFD